MAPPQYTVITIATGSNHELRKTLDAVERTLVGTSFESTIVCNGLPTAEGGLENHRVVSTVLTTATAISPGALLNSALERARGDKVAFFGCGAMPAPFWQRAAERVFARAEVVAAAARILDSGAQRVRSCGIGIRDGRFACSQAGLPADARSALRPSGLDLAPLCGLVVRRDAFDLIGGFDTGFSTSLFDLDWTLRARVKGGIIAYCPDFIVRFDGPIPLGMIAIERQSAEHFLTRWQAIFSPALEAEQFLP